MGKPVVVSGWQGAKFGDVDFAQYITSWEDTRETSGPIHKYIKVDGGEGEPTGRDPHKAVVHCAFMGPKWRDKFLALQATIDDKPIQSLTHPVYGPMDAFAKSSAGRMDIETAPDFYDVTFTFIESRINTKVTAPQQIDNQGPQAQNENISAAVNLVATFSVLFASAASALAQLTSAAITYSSAALASASSLTADPTLPQQLATVLTLSNAAQAAVAADPHAAPGVSDPAMAAIELLYDACTQMADAVAALRPTLSLFTVPMMMSLLALSQQFYGPADGLTREGEILANNPGAIPDPIMIPGGTQLWMAPATYAR